MKAYSHEKHAKKLWKKIKKKVQTHGQSLGRGMAGDMGLNFLVFLAFPLFFAVWPKPRENQKNKKFRPMGKVWGEAWLGTWV